MTTTLFKHAGKCKGNLVIDISDLFSFSTPSISVSPDEIRTGTLEIKEKSSGRVRFICLSCKETVDFTSADKVTAQCIFCRKYKPSTEIWISHQLSCTCTSCKNVLEGEREPDSAELAETMKYLLLPKDSIKFVKLSDVLQNNRDS